MQPLVSTYTIVPTGALRAYVSHYAIRKFDTGELVFPKAMIADNEFLVNFFLKGKLYGFDKKLSSEYTYSKKNAVECYYSSIQTSTKGLVLFSGDMIILTVHFQPTGFYSIFDISPKELLDAHGETSTILGNDINLLYEQMLEINSSDKCIKVIEKYLLQRLMTRKLRYRHLGIAPAAALLVKRMGSYSMVQLADDLNLTQQTMEVQFKTQIGVDPKTFCRLIRFKKALNLRIYNQSMTWTEIAYSCGFYDQAHLIKDFKKFTDISPNDFIREIKPPVENFDPQ